MKKEYEIVMDNDDFVTVAAENKTEARQKAIDDIKLMTQYCPQYRIPYKILAINEI